MTKWEQIAHEEHERADALKVELDRSLSLLKQMRTLVMNHPDFQKGDSTKALGIAVTSFLDKHHVI